MKYMLLICEDPSARPKTQAEGEELMARYGTFTQAIVESGEFVSGDPLQGIETATSVRVRNGRTTTVDGPFAETKEHLGGYYVLDVKDLDRALELAAQIPSAATGTIEVRPIQEM